MRVVVDAIVVVLATAVGIAAIVGVVAPRESRPATAPVTTATVTTTAPPTAASRAYYGRQFSKHPTVPAMVALGAKLFRDPALSASGKLACATCHDPGRAFASPSDRAVMFGGPNGDAPGVRAVPSLRYLQAVPRFTEHFHDGEDDSTDQGPAGGLTWDGRVDTAHDQARAPLFSPFEMANRSEAELVARLRAAPYAGELRAAFGDDLFASTDGALAAATRVLEVYQQDPATFYPYTSKFDAVIRGTATLSAAEARGKAVFDDPKRGNCARCHPDKMTTGFPAFTDFGFVAIGVPRERSIPATADPAYVDLGLCGPYRVDFAKRAAYCGQFRTPSLRNVALRRRFMHDGHFTSLADVVAFYATRDVTPARWYGADAPDDLPAPYRANLDREIPFGTKTPTMTAAEQADILAFLATLTDGYSASP